MEVRMMDEVPTSSFTDSTDDAPFRCEVCGTSLTYSGRGRRPKFCDEHKKSSPNKTHNTRSTNMRALEESLADLYRGLGMGVAFMDEDSGMLIAGSADKLAHSWIVLAETNPKVKKFLVKVTTGTGVGAVVIAHAAVAIPIMKSHGMLDFLGGVQS